MQSHPFINLFFGICFLSGQTPFLEIRPYVKPDFVQYDLKNHVDHHYPTANITDGNFRRFDGVNLTDDLMFPNCDQGSACYDGHAGVDYYMPAGTPILAPASGYVIWSAFSPGADPCPGGISPNGNTPKDDISASCNDYLRFFGYFCLSFIWLKTMRKSYENLENNKEFYEDKLNTGNYYFDKILPRAESHYKSAISGSKYTMSAKFN